MIDLTSAKVWLKKETSDEDTLIGDLVAAAIKTIEGKTSKFLSPKEVVQTEDGFPRSCRGDRPIRLWHGPVSGDAVAIEYDDGNGDPQPLTSFRLIEGTDAKILPAYGQCWPLTHCGEATVRVTYTAGFDAEDVTDLDQAALMLVAHWYLNREAVTVGSGAAAIELPLSVTEIIRPYLTPRLG